MLATSATEARMFIKRPVKLRLKLRAKDPQPSQESLASTMTASQHPLPTPNKKPLRDLPRKSSSRTLIHCEALPRFTESAVEMRGETREREKRSYESMSKIAPVESGDFLEQSSFGEDDSLIHELADLLTLPEVPEAPPRPLKSQIRIRSSISAKREEFHLRPRMPSDIPPSTPVMSKKPKSVIRRKKIGPLSLSKLLSPPVTTRQRIVADAGARYCPKPVIALNL